MELGNSKILAYENNWHKRKFIESFFINNKSNSLQLMQEIQFNFQIFAKTCLTTSTMIFKLRLIFADWVLKNAILFVLRL